MRPIFFALGLILLGSPAFAQGANRLPDTTRAEQQIGDVNRSLSQQLQFQQQNQSLQWQIDQQRLRQQIDIRPSRGSSATCPAGWLGC